MRRLVDFFWRILGLSSNNGRVEALEQRVERLEHQKLDRW